jgi:hypothetical protein
LGEKQDDSKVCGQPILWYMSLFIWTFPREEINVGEIFRFLRKFIDQDLSVLDSDHLFPIETRSVLFPGTRISQGLVMHQTFGLILQSHRENIAEFFVGLCSHVGADPQVMAVYLPILPLRLFAACHQAEFGLFARNATGVIIKLSSFGFRESILLRLLPLFILIQACLGISTDQNRFITNIASVFGLFEDGFDFEATSNLCFTFVFFLSCLITDRHCIRSSSREFLKSFLTELLMERGPMTRETIEKELWMPLLKTGGVGSVLEELTEVKETGQRNDRQLKEEFQSHFLYPWMSHQNLLKIAAKFLAKNPAGLLPFPESEKDPAGLSLSSCLFQPFIFAIEYHVVNNWVWKNSSQQIASVHFVFGLLKLAGQLLERKLFLTNYHLWQLIVCWICPRNCGIFHLTTSCSFPFLIRAGSRSRFVR